jgi:hypothetical protein
LILRIYGYDFVMDEGGNKLPPAPSRGGVNAVIWFDFGDFQDCLSDGLQFLYKLPPPPLKGGVGFVIQLDFGDFQDCYQTASFTTKSAPLALLEGKAMC